VLGSDLRGWDMHGHGDAGLNFYFVWASFFWTLLVRKLDTYLTTLL